MPEPYIAWHQTKYPEMTAQDLVKLIFQAYCGCGHLLASEPYVVDRILQEEAALQPDTQEPLTEPLGETYCRLNLRPAMAAGISAPWIVRLMAVSVQPTDVQKDRCLAYETLRQLKETEVGFSQVELEPFARQLLSPDWLPGHSERYRAAYAPAYRVISCEEARLLPVLVATGTALMRQPRVLMCLDGPCGSGKSTLARRLAKLMDAAVIPMDDFYTPHSQKTPERLAQPGGNADIERLLEEVVLPWSLHKSIAYRPYLCSEDVFGAQVRVPDQPLTILEGSYSLYPSLAKYADVRVFLTIDPELQHQRLLAREGEKGWMRFAQQWIPLEQAYYQAFSLPDETCLCLQY